MLAQFDKNEQCTKGVQKLIDFWSLIKDEDDIFISNNSPIKKCFNSLNFERLFTAFNSLGGFCTQKPGLDKYKNYVDNDLIMKSNMELHTFATNMDQGKMVHFNKK